MSNIELIDSMMNEVNNFTTTGVQNMAAILKIYNGLATLRESLQKEENSEE